MVPKQPQIGEDHASLKEAGSAGFYGYQASLPACGHPQGPIAGQRFYRIGLDQALRQAAKRGCVAQFCRGLAIDWAG